MFQRPQLDTLKVRLKSAPRFLQILAGPRQVGKTTLARQAMAAFEGAVHYASADLPAAPHAQWIEQHWRVARLDARGDRAALLVLDEVHKVPRWSETVKMLWDEDRAARCNLHVVLLGSSQFLMQRGLLESLTGRFELIRLPHWSFAEMQAAFGWGLEQFIFFGGYPGAAVLVADEARWKSYVLDAIVEPTLARDVMGLARVDKPVLLRRLFFLGCAYSGQILAYQKMIGQLQDAGNTTTLAHYLNLLAAGWMLTGLDKYAADFARTRASSPKLQVFDTALISAQSRLGFAAARADGEFWGRLVESAVGAHLLNASSPGTRIAYWRERGLEVDFVLYLGERVLPIEVKSGRSKGALPGMEKFCRNFGTQTGLVVGSGGVALEVFFTTPPERWLE